MPTPIFCPTSDDWRRWLRNPAGEQATGEFGPHLESCAACRQTVEQMLMEDETCSGVPLREAGASSTTETVLQQLLEQVRRGSGSATVSNAARGGEESFDFLTPSDDPAHLGRLEHYEVLELIGRGGMGIVLKARDASLDRVVAIKVLAPELASNATARKRFLREAKTAAAVTHQHVVTIHAVGEDRLPYLVMECVSGQSLQDKLDQQGPLELREILRIGTQVAAGLAAAHAHGVIHRDIKPANILLENGIERVRITDFGLARAVDDVTMTKTGEVAGTPQYMSPEQAQGQPVDARSDLFSFGSVLYAMCTGRPPFRAETTIDAIRRVCDDTPRPIREINAEVPEWLTAIIDRLLAKRPEERFQTAQEVAQLLGQHLAHVQDPGSTPFPHVIPPSPPRGEGPGVRGGARRRWVAAAVVLLAALAALGATEATGLTHLAGRVIRIVTGEGTLIIEIDDPTVQVSLDGEELTISGGGVEQVRLRPGQYQFTATKDGRPIQQELVTITRGGERVVTVRREAISPTITAPQPTVEAGAFVILRGEGIPEHKFDTLAEAVTRAGDGDTIEIRGNGPFVSEPSRLRHALTIRAGNGFRPVIMQRPLSTAAQRHLIEADAPLVLEGLELQQTTPWKSDDPWQALVVAPKLHVANCRFSLLHAYGSAIHVLATDCHVRNCDFVCSPDAIGIYAPYRPALSVTVDNSCFWTGSTSAIAFDYKGEPMEEDRGQDQELLIRLTRNTFSRGHEILILNVFPDSWTNLAKQSRMIRVEASQNVISTDRALILGQWGGREHELPVADAEAALRRILSWHGQQNVYAFEGSFAALYLQGADLYYDLKPPTRSLAEWKAVWDSPETDSAHGPVDYWGGDVVAKGRASPAELSPDDFRLRPDSPGYRAGPDGKDLGADIDLVGPGAAYERWKKTVEYQQWLEDSGQLMKRLAVQPELKAFVVLGGQGAEVGNYDTLAEAVLGASAGDTIEIRGNGPFVSEPTQTTQALTIRAATGFRPTILGIANPLANGGSYLLYARGPLVLEGLDLRMTTSDFSVVVESEQAPLHVANCRLVLHGSGFPIQVHSPLLTVRNCEFARTADSDSEHIVAYLFDEQAIVLDNNVFGDPFGRALGLVWGSRELHNVTIRLNHNTMVASTSFVHGFRVVPESAAPGAHPDGQPVRIHVSANLFDPIDRDGTCFLILPPDWFHDDAKPLSAEEVERLLPHLVAWREERNLYRKGMILQRMPRITDRSKPDRGEVMDVLPAGRALADWQRLWNSGNGGSAEGMIRYEGGDVLAKSRTMPDRIAAADFRLRPDSAGYQAGPDGKDLGADVDLVGPGAAYERWKTTPEYQQWLQETGQNSR